MITTPQDYYSKLHLIGNAQQAQIAVLLPSNEKIYNVNLNTREIETPEFLSIAKDHFAETVYFEMDRFYDHVDLATATGIIQFENANKELHLYKIPIIDITTKPGKIIFPWCIDGAATAAAGTIKYSFNFYNVKKSPNVDENGNFLGAEFEYSLNTKVATSKILNGLDVDKNKEEYKGLASALEIEINRLEQLSRDGLEWIKL